MRRQLLIMGTRASEAARAVNSLLAFTGDDQQGLLEVMEDYFTLPDDQDRHDDSDDDEDDSDVMLEGKQLKNKSQN